MSDRRRRDCRPRIARGSLRAASTLLVPILSGTATARRTLEGVIARAEAIRRAVHAGGSPAAERHRGADERRARSLAAAHAGVTGSRRASTPTPPPTMVGGTTRPASALHVPVCRLYKLRRRGRRLCPDEAALQPVMGMPPVVDGMHRVDAVIGAAAWAPSSAPATCGSTRDVAVKVVRADLVLNPDARALPARGADRRPAAASGDRDGLRLRHAARRRRLPGDGVRPRRRPAPSAQAREGAERGAVEIATPAASPRIEAAHAPACCTATSSRRTSCCPTNGGRPEGARLRRREDPTDGRDAA